MSLWEVIALAANIGKFLGGLGALLGGAAAFLKAVLPLLN